MPINFVSEKTPADILRELQSKGALPIKIMKGNGGGKIFSIGPVHFLPIHPWRPHIILRKNECLAINFNDIIPGCILKLCQQINYLILSGQE